MGLLGCISKSAAVGPTFDLKTHILGIWETIGSCQFTTLTESAVEVKGNASFLKQKFDFDILVTDGSNGQPILTVNGQPDPKATRDGCTIQAHDTLDGIKVTFTTYKKINTEIKTPDPYPNVFINPR
jgi:hypothetical protein